MRNVVYLARSRIENAQLIARQVKAANQCVPAAALVERAIVSQPSQYDAAEKCILTVSIVAKALYVMIYDTLCQLSRHKILVLLTYVNTTL